MTANAIRKLAKELRQIAEQASDMNPIDPDYLAHMARRFEMQAEQVELGIAE